MSGKFNLKKPRATLLPPEQAQEVLNEGDNISISETVKVSSKKRSLAKRNDPNYVSFTTYIKRENHIAAKIALLQEGRGRELSELVDDLIAEWLKSQN
ncbi:MAG: hypothetical protein AB1489_30585 [Acidobacteriota bacterium]